MKDRMIIIRKGVVFIITVSHEQTQQQEQEVQETTPLNEQGKEVRLPDITISAN